MALFSRRSHRDDRSERAQAWEAYQRGKALFEQRRWLEAAEEFGKSTELAPEVVHPRLSHGAALTNAGRTEEALELLRTCLRSHPDNSDVHNSIGMTLGKLGRHREAAVHIVQAARLGHPQAAETMRKLDMDYCRKCHRPVYRTPAAQADVHVMEPTIGMECRACSEVFCIPCLQDVADSILIPPCPRCGGGLLPMECESR
jgi:Flp pilus assembly protein TadD